MGKDNRLRRRDVLKTSGGIVGGLAMSGTLPTSVAAQSTYYRYQQVRVRLIDVDTTPPRFLTAESPLYLPQALLAQCSTDHPCSLDVLDYRRTGDDNDDNGDDDDNDDDDSCPGFASVVLLCHGESASEAVVVTGLIRDVLSRFAGQGMDYAVKITPSGGTNINNPERVSNPCPGSAGVDDDDQDGDDDADGDDGDDDQGGDDDADDDDNAGQDNDDDGGDDQGGDDDDDNGDDG